MQSNMTNARIILWILLSLAVLTQVEARSDRRQATGSLPTCVLSCGTGAADAVGCSGLQFPCVCQSSTFLPAVEQCMSVNCSVAEQAQGVAFFEDACGTSSSTLSTPSSAEPTIVTSTTSSAGTSLPSSAEPSRSVSVSSVTSIPPTVTGTSISTTPTSAGTSTGTGAGIPTATSVTVTASGSATATPTVATSTPVSTSPSSAALSSSTTTPSLPTSSTTSTRTSSNIVTRSTSTITVTSAGTLGNTSGAARSASGARIAPNVNFAGLGMVLAGMALGGLAVAL